jgi:PAS domain S-box-containing protein
LTCCASSKPKCAGPAQRGKEPHSRRGGGRSRRMKLFAAFVPEAFMRPDQLHSRYRELQAYVGWTDPDAARVRAAGELLEPHLAAVVDDFYAEIERHPGALRVITGGTAQIARLKGTLLNWLRELFAGPYDEAYVARRWRVGWRHVEIGLDQVYANVALSRLRSGLVRLLEQGWCGKPEALQAVVRSLQTLLDLDLAIIEDAYQAEYASRRQRAERRDALRTLVQVAPCMVVILRPDLSVAYFSPYAEGLTGHTAAEVAGQDYIARFVPDEHRPPVAANLRGALSGTALQGSEHPVRCRDGSSRHMVWNAQALPDYEGERAVLLVGQDITNLKEAQERALQSVRLAAIGEMVAALAHESRNALQRSQACLEMLAMEVEGRPEALDLVERIQKAQDRLHRLFEDVRSYAGTIRLEPRLCNLADIWREAWTTLAPLRERRDTQLREETGGLNLYCEVDNYALEQVFRNIFDNALAACGDPTRIEVRCAEGEVDGREALRVEVQDNGPGLNAEQRRKIFEPFFTTKTKGTGLGMAIARRIVEAHAGRLVVGDNPQPGATLVISLPRDRP